MIALELTKIKETMGKLLLSDCFDSFLLIQSEITTFNTFQIDGYLHKNFFEEDTLFPDDYSSWKEIKEYCYSIIKGSRTPLKFNFIFGLSSQNIEKLLHQSSLSYQLSDVKGLYINLRFDGQKLVCTTGTSMNTFTMDKSLENVWDDMVTRFLTVKDIL